jgi:hypothetical protein
MAQDPRFNPQDEDFQTTREATTHALRDIREAGAISEQGGALVEHVIDLMDEHYPGYLDDAEQDDQTFRMFSLMFGVAALLTNLEDRKNG